MSNVKTGEIVAMVSLPDFDPNNPKEAHDPDRINRLTTGVYEMGSTFKTLTLAMALDSAARPTSTRCTTRAVRSATASSRSTTPIRCRVRSRSPEVFTFSSNVGAAKIALGQGVEAHKAFLKKVGQLDRLRTELPESAMPIVPKRWGELNTITIAFGHGMAVAPLQAVMGVNAHGQWRAADPADLPEAHRGGSAGDRPSGSSRTRPATKMRYMMRLNAEVGSARAGRREGLLSSAARPARPEKVVNGRYSKKQVLNSFTPMLPADNPQYQLLVMLDEPKPLPETHGFITSGWNAVPTGGKVIARIAPLLGHRAPLRSGAVRPPYSCDIQVTQ